VKLKKTLFQNNKKEKDYTECVQLTVLPLLAERMEEKFDVFEALLDTLSKNNEKLQDGDVLVISTKYISNSQERNCKFG